MNHALFPASFSFSICCSSDISLCPHPQGAWCSAAFVATAHDGATARRSCAVLNCIACAAGRPALGWGAEDTASARPSHCLGLLLGRTDAPNTCGLASTAAASDAVTRTRVPVPVRVFLPAVAQGRARCCLLL
ncbi:hypothetical protein PTSG_12164 [Salpingoeca rosetta]|uniref:Uncharacterized protein n=1 Tax=Salpingoeca rosetta (strain ATCC 50818 / BSB-021) TaxID=946362 RepID=F2U8F1_SALR5|nr:uncharacterized protein PTSG_12164 [Salpingoeca rosetta]EGD72659.1 hypothetical protein PTSG_12164 [Salpingoeca rosetta]|eukprot:XP_004994482.1 hypothetical protein PTSG_12164 [Salpingoeca rosetta]